MGDKKLVSISKDLSGDPVYDFLKKLAPKNCIVSGGVITEHKVVKATGPRKTIDIHFRRPGGPELISTYNYNKVKNGL